MVKIKFTRELDQMMFKDQLRDKDLMWRVINDFEVEMIDHNQEVIGQTLCEMFYYVDLKPMLIERLINKYYYYDFSEINAILSFAAQMLLTDTYKNVSFLSDLRETIKHYFKVESGQTIFDYEKEKKRFFDQAGWLMDEVTAQAIDEKKQDEQYQIFLQSLREYIKKQKLGPRCYVKWGEGAIDIYQENGHKYTRQELEQRLLQAPIHIYQFANNEHQVSPFLALNPEQIMIYPEDDTDPALTALQNIFDERIVIVRDQSFPFENNRGCI